mmetsp:Transcript_5865/g.14684  ORF Transcript_5865/g.14684 Transcript_5865/m.14684 type:complete len:104 (-) Transcript_5865:122-433(-)
MHGRRYMTMERHRLPIVETSGQHRMFHALGALALWISFIVGGIFLFLVCDYEHQLTCCDSATGTGLDSTEAQEQTFKPGSNVQRSLGRRDQCTGSRERKRSES